MGRKKKITKVMEYANEGLSDFGGDLGGDFGTGLAGGFDTGGLDDKPPAPDEGLLYKDEDYTGDAEVDSNMEMSELQKAFKKGTRNLTAGLLDVWDTEFWFCVCFRTREEKNAFLKVAKLFEHGDKYLDGREVARIMGIDYKAQWETEFSHAVAAGESMHKTPDKDLSVERPLGSKAPGMGAAKIRRYQSIDD